MTKTVIFLEGLKKSTIKSLVEDYYQNTVNASKKIKSISIDTEMYGADTNELIQVINVTFTDGTTGSVEWNCVDKNLY